MNQAGQGYKLPVYKLKYFWTGILLVLALIPFFLSHSDAFFWDTIQFAGKNGLYYYEHGWGFLPHEIDSGHLPFLGYYLAHCWKLFGVSLLVSHLAILPFIFIYIWTTERLSRVISKKNASWLWLLFLIEPCWMAQTTLVSPDIILMAGFALSCLGYAGTDKASLFFGSILLALSGNRGAALICAVALAMILWNKTNRKAIICLLPGFSLFALYQTAHLYHLGWVGFHPDMEWAPSFERVGISGMIKNFCLVLWRLVDTGRIFLCLILCYFFLRNKRHLELIKQPLVILMLTTATLLLVLTLPYKYLTGHRYFMPLYFLLIALLPIFTKALTQVRQKFILIVIAVFYVTGHFLIYPRGIAMGWDSTMAYLPYQRLREDVVLYLNSRAIDIKQTGSDFPNISGFRATDLKLDSKEGFKYYEIGKDEYLLYSNIMNEMSDDFINILKQYDMEQIWRRGQIEFILFKKKQ